MIKKTCLLAFFVFVTISLFASVSLPRIFGDNMVLQRDKPINVWGWGSAGEKITVSFHGQTRMAKADKQGRWSLQLGPESAGGPYELKVTGKSGPARTFSNVMVGEVWICSGQSNMEMQIAGWGRINNYQQEIAAADYSAIRHIKVPNTTALAPQEDIPSGDWKVCSPETAGDFSATAYFFAREIYQKLHIPIGLINTSWGGTMVETWTSKGAFEQSDEYKDMITSMPPLADMKVLAQQKKEALTKVVLGLQGSMPAAGEEAQYASADLDDSKWPHMKVPGTWEQAGLGLDALDGVVWFRKVIEVSEADAGKAAVLAAGEIDDADETYVNGTKVGATTNYAAQRQYNIPAGLLKAGRNVIAVRVLDTGGGGGIYAGEFKCTIGDHELPLAGEWSFRVADIAMSTAVGPNSAPTLLFNAMINPLIPYTIRGAIWYQGEANAGRAYQYRKGFPLMIMDWRARWKEGDFPFYFVQLASFNAGNGNSGKGSSWAELREAQAMTLSLPNTGMAVTTDIGNATDIHPKNKQDVGKRLAYIALHNIYGQSLEYSGPVYKSMQASGDKVTLQFDHVGGGLSTPDVYGYLRGFEVAGTDHQWHYAKAFIEGNTVTVWQDGVTAPVAVRYGWADFAGEANLFNKDGLPAVPFRTDQWKGVTEEVKYTVGK
ncbi:sialate O-acetylesterase [Flavitalea sp. BT771]|uniref:sialate O-acetylesterase n=1 Tax=Flavitalea sp. BT771 TaxID=3063329 RepID=UPI0026E3DC5F|nr:sialate O-acetylesterase [Flavitalea sp. BT771]MDO6434500.1 sialate O-acetylesterase [Flavitalea sp. BT771]MDV6223400.1 sialate O-acetylesterase [Flavitalea sp. BT771]